ncbi:MAG TPA: hypothetical protein P5274_02680 [Candidatus Paceibacterota bacterium]|nr:hypothetical protein [Candidatus Paceibacterota bacterium]
MDTQKIAERMAGYATLTAVSVIIDDVLWPAVMLWQGAVFGGITMFWIALLANLVMLWAYDKLKRDVLCFEALRELTEQEPVGLGKQLLVRAIHTGRVPAFIAISFYDPFLSVIYMRRGAGKYTMENRDWSYFALAMAIACLGWTFFWQVIIIAGEIIWNFF